MDSPSSTLKPINGLDVVTSADGKGQGTGHLPSCRLPDEGSCCTHILLLPSAWLSCGPRCLASLLSGVCVCMYGDFDLFPSSYVAATRFDAFLSKQKLRVVFQPGSSLESQQNDKQDRWLSFLLLMGDSSICMFLHLKLGFSRLSPSLHQTWLWVTEMLAVCFPLLFQHKEE